MSEFTINTITLPPAQANGDFSNWFDQLEAIGFTKVYYNDTLQVDKMRWKDSPFGLRIDGAKVCISKLKSDNTYQDVGSSSSYLVTNTTTTTNTTKFFYRYINDTNSIMFGGDNSSASSSIQQKLFAVFYAPEDSNDLWNCYNQGYVGTGGENDPLITAASTQIGYISGYPISSVALLPFWTGSGFKKDVYVVPLMPQLPVASLFRVVVNDKVYIINDWNKTSQRMGLAFDITDEDASANPSA